MLEFFSVIVATFVTIPLLGYIIVFVLTKLVTKQHRKSVKVASDVTTLLLVISVHYMILAIWNISLFWIIILTILFIASLFVITHWKVKHEIRFLTIFKEVWRFNFLLFGFVYVILLLFGLVTNVRESISFF